jgi:prepilin-type N-terminal cleavage/methylation domain-containing protein
MNHSRFIHSGFTLVELMIAMSILSIMITMVFSVYFQITDTERKLAHARILSDTAREITERITTDITES